MWNFSLDFFTEELSCDRACTDFVDHRGKTNKELLSFMLDLYRDLNRPVYVRNYSFLGFHSYQFVVPGFSETRGLRLTEPVCEYGLGDAVQKAFRNVAAANTVDLMMLLTFHKKISTAFSRKKNFRGLAGLPLDYTHNRTLTAITLSCAAYRLGRYATAKNYLDSLLNRESIAREDRDYFSCIHRYLSLKAAKVSDEKIRLLLGKFYEETVVDKLCSCLERGKTPYDEYLMKCDCVHCSDCRYQANCSYTRSREIIGKAGERYQAFTDGQSEEFFRI